MKHKAALYSFLTTFFIVSLIISFTSVGFPYSDNKAEPRLQRFRIVHTKRTLYDSSGIEKFSDINYLFATIDRNSERTLQSTLNSSYPLFTTSEAEKCSEIVSCGFPRLNSILQGKYIKSSVPPKVKPTELRIINKLTNGDTVKFTFTIKFTSLNHITLQIDNDWEFVNSSLPLIGNSANLRTSRVTVGKQVNEFPEEFVEFKV